jgi:hypothetical protein
MKDEHFHNLLRALNSLAGILIDYDNSKEDLETIGKIYTDLGLLIRMKRAERAYKKQRTNE